MLGGEVREQSRMRLRRRLKILCLMVRKARDPSFNMGKSVIVRLIRRTDICLYDKKARNPASNDKNARDFAFNGKKASDV